MYDPPIGFTAPDRRERGDEDREREDFCTDAVGPGGGGEEESSAVALSLVCLLREREKSKKENIFRSFLQFPLSLSFSLNH